MQMHKNALEYMKRLRVFKGFSEGELDLLLTVFTVKRFAAGQALCKQGDSYACLFIVVVGEVAVFREVGPNKRMELTRAGVDCILGEKSLIDGQPRSASMEAVCPTITLECNRADFLRLFKANSPFAYKMMDMVVTQLVGRLRGIDRVIEDVLSNPSNTLSNVVDALTEASGLIGAGVHISEDKGPKKHYIDPDNL